jgi:hypothetical protein
MTEKELRFLKLSQKCVPLCKKTIIALALPQLMRNCRNYRSHPSTPNSIYLLKREIIVSWN